MKRQKVTASSLSQLSSSLFAQRQGLVRSMERINLQYLLSFAGNPNDKSFDVNSFLHFLFNYFTSDAFPQVVKFLKELLTGMDRPLLTSMGDVTIIQSGFIQVGLIPELSDCILAPLGDAVLNYNRNEISHEPSVRNVVFGICLKILGLYRQQIFVVITGEEKVQTVLWFTKVLLFFLPVVLVLGTLRKLHTSSTRK